MKPQPLSETEAQRRSDEWAVELLGDQVDRRFVVVRYNREWTGGKRHRQDLIDADRKLLAACESGASQVAAEIVASLSHYTESGFAFGETVAELSEVLAPRVQKWQVNYDIADWGNGGAMLTVWAS